MSTWIDFGLMFIVAMLAITFYSWRQGKKYENRVAASGLGGLGPERLAQAQYNARKLAEVAPTTGCACGKSHTVYLHNPEKD